MFLRRLVYVALFAFFSPALRAQAPYADSNSCAECHIKICTQWKNSDHAHSMDHVAQKSVQGNFQNKTFQHIGFDDIALLTETEIKTFLARLETSRWEFDPRRQYLDKMQQHNIKGRKALYPQTPCFNDLALARVRKLSVANLGKIGYTGILVVSLIYRLVIIFIYCHNVILISLRFQG